MNPYRSTHNLLIIHRLMSVMMNEINGLDV
jgi:hypothetical protein